MIVEPDDSDFILTITPTNCVSVLSPADFEGNSFFQV